MVIFGVGVLVGFLFSGIGSAPVVEETQAPVGDVQEEQKEITVELTIDDGDKSIQTFSGGVLTKGDTVLDLLYAMEERHGLVVKKRDFPGMGVFIEGIGGIENSNDTYWQYWVNDEHAKVAAGEYILEDGDQVLWKRTNERPE